VRLQSAALVAALPVSTSAASLEPTSISSASLRAVEVPQSLLDSLPADELELSPRVESAAPRSSVEAPTALPTLKASKAAPAPAASRRGWLMLGAGAVLALGVVLAQRGPASEERAPASLAAPAEPAGSQVVAEPPAAGPLPATPAPAESVVAEVPTVEAASPPAPSAAPATPPPAPAYNEKALEGALHWGISNAEQCHRAGRPIGTAKATLTFGPSGRILHAELEGEPIASNPVGKCILSFLRSMMIPAFAGPEFTVTREITLR